MPSLLFFDHAVLTLYEGLYCLLLRVNDYAGVKIKAGETLLEEERLYREFPSTGRRPDEGWQKCIYTNKENNEIASESSKRPGTMHGPYSAPTLLFKLVLYLTAFFLPTRLY